MWTVLCPIFFDTRSHSCTEHDGRLWPVACFEVNLVLFFILLHFEDFGISYAINTDIKRFVKFVLSSAYP